MDIGTLTFIVPVHFKVGGGAHIYDAKFQSITHTTLVVKHVLRSRIIFNVNSVFVQLVFTCESHKRECRNAILRPSIFIRALSFTSNAKPLAVTCSSPCDLIDSHAMQCESM